MNTTSPAPALAATFRFFGDLNDFLDPAPGQGPERHYRFRGRPSVKDAIEAQGIPHPEVALILVSGKPVGFDYGLAAGDRLAVYPDFETGDVNRPGGLRPVPAGEPRFVLDVNLGKLARWLRLLGFDALYRNNFHDAELAALAARDERIVLTRDRRLLFHGCIVHGAWIRHDIPDQQVLEVIRRFRLAARIRPLHRCTRCNDLIAPASPTEVWERLEPKTRLYYQDFFQCRGCRRVYWRGSHYDGIIAKIRHATAGRPEYPKSHLPEKNS
jgi:uncharacterized protein with PIN domain